MAIEVVSVRSMAKADIVNDSDLVEVDKVAW